MLKTRKPASIKTCVLTQKEGKSVETHIDYLGFEIPDVWVVGYGLDFAERHRTWPFIAELRQDTYKDKWGICPRTILQEAHIPVSTAEEILHQPKRRLCAFWYKNLYFVPILFYNKNS